MDNKISALNSATVLTDADVLPIINGAETKKVSIATIKSTINGVPYTGATTNVDLGEFQVKAGQYQYDLTPTGTAGVGITRWNSTLGITETTILGGNTVLKNGIDSVARIVNKSSTDLTKAGYQVVKVKSAQGGRLAVALAQANSDNNSVDTFGIACENISNNQEGYIMTFGQLEEINTTGSLQGETWADGNVLYLSPSVAGRITNIKPNGLTGHIVVLGYVEYAHAIHGSIYVKIMNGWELDELHNVYINGELNNQALIYETSSQLWKNKSITDALGYTPIKSVVKDCTQGSTITGVTTEILTGTYLIPANTFATNDIMKITSFLAEKTGVAGTCIMRVKVSSSNVFSSATTIATFTGASTTIQNIINRNSLTIRSGFIRVISSITSILTDVSATGSTIITPITFNPAIDNYIFTSLQLSVGTDSVFQSNFIVTN